MAPYEYLLPLISVLVGLALADLVTSLHRLLRARRRVRWDALSLLAAVLAALLILDLWWGFYGRLAAPTIAFGNFLPAIAQLTVLFLLTASVLPDDVPEEGIDLRTFYDETRSYFWTLIALYLGIVLGYNLILHWAGWGGVPRLMLAQAINLALLGLFATLAISGRRWLHAVALVLVVGLFMADWWGRQLSL